MRIPVLPLYASAHGATLTEVGLITGAHMGLAALSAIPFGYASDRWGRRAFLLGGTAVSAVTSLLLPLVGSPAALMVIYGAAGLGVSAFTPSVMSFVGDITAPGAAGRAYGWYTMALYTGMGVGPVLGGFVAEQWGDRSAFVIAGAIIVVAVGVAVLLPQTGARAHRSWRASFADLRQTRIVWSGWIATVSGLGAWGAIATFFPLLARERGITPFTIGLVFGIQALSNTVARVPVGWLLDQTRARRPYVLTGVLALALGTGLIPTLSDARGFILMGAALGVALAVAFVAIGAVLSENTTPATRGVAMGGYSTAIYVGFGLASVGLGPVIAHWGYAAGFALAGAGAVMGTVIAATLWPWQPAR